MIWQSELFETNDYLELDLDLDYFAIFYCTFMQIIKKI